MKNKQGKKNVPNKLHNILHATNLTQAQLIKASGLNASTIHKTVRQEINPRPKSQILIVEALNILTNRNYTVSYVFETKYSGPHFIKQSEEDDDETRYSGPMSPIPPHISADEGTDDDDTDYAGPHFIKKGDSGDTKDGGPHRKNGSNEDVES